MLKHCKGCVWATDCGGVTYCPWPSGACVKIKGSFEDRDEFKLRKKILRAEYGIEPVTSTEGNKK